MSAEITPEEQKLCEERSMENWCIHNQHWLPLLRDGGGRIAIQKLDPTISRTTYQKTMRKGLAWGLVRKHYRGQGMMYKLTEFGHATIERLQKSGDIVEEQHNGMETNSRRTGTSKQKRETR